MSLLEKNIDKKPFVEFTTSTELYTSYLFTAATHTHTQKKLSWPGMPGIVTFYLDDGFQPHLELRQRVERPGDAIGRDNRAV